ncbi:site-specific integrase [Sandarakinorhabdus sp.]|uniref:site-specific integrase n=1 Tax=Sandarakinorhabdus sp. TaxID=1916663 RepID=UPI0028A9B831|nr:site-specific integrase [Sandarakinorhabdus sp.]
MPKESEFTVQRYRDGWAIVFKDASGKRKRWSLDAIDRQSAEAEARKRWSLRFAGKWTVGRIVSVYLDAREEAEIASIARRRNAWKAMAAFWTDVDPELIDEKMCRDYVDQRKRAPATTRYELAMLAAALNHAAEAKHIQKAPKVWRPAEPEHIARALSRQEFRRFFDAVLAPHVRLFVILALSTCSRPGALLELEWIQIDFEKGLIRLNPIGRVQTKKKRPTVPIADYAVETLTEAFAVRQSQHVIERGGKMLASIRKAFAAASKRSGVHATPFTLRHTGAVWRAEDGISMSELAQLMGHSNEMTTFRYYARYSPTYMRKAANAGKW